MFDYHMHTRVSFDAHETGEAMAKAALANGLKEICFTDHIDYDPLGKMGCMAFDTAVYNAEYDHLEVPGLKIRRGMEFGMAADNVEQFKLDLQRRHFDFAEYWSDKTIFQAERRYLETTLECVQIHNDFDVLAHLTYIAKAQSHPAHRPVPFGDHREIIDEILRIVAAKGKGLEMNTSGMDRCGGFLPTADIFRRFKELGGQIVTIGSDAHTCSRVGQYAFEVCETLKDVFGYVCTFEDRKPIFHKL